MGRITVTLRERSYPIIIAAGSFNEPASFLPLKSGDQVMLVINETLAPLYLDGVRSVLEQVGANVDNVTLPDGEQYKNLIILDTAFTMLLRRLHGRDTTLVAPSDGVIGDLTGFVAANHQRGVCLIQVPATLSSQVDSSIGGKTTVSHPPGKNIIDVFYQPASVTVDLDRLRAFPARELASGLVEVIKYSIILDGEFSSWLEDDLDALLRLDGPTTVYYIRHYCELRVEVAAADERKVGLHALLSLGCTFGHAIKVEMGHGDWLHGEAVAAGTVMIARTPERLGQFTSADTQRIIASLQQMNLPVDGPREMSTETYLLHMLRDKEVLMGKIRLVLPRMIGKGKVYGRVPHGMVPNAIADCQQA